MMQKVRTAICAFLLVMLVVVDFASRFFSVLADLGIVAVLVAVMLVWPKPKPKQ